jgi:ribosome-binding factor A
MPADHRRSDRVAAAIREEVAKALAAGVKDPRIARLTTVTGCEITRDLRHATVFISVMGDDGARAATLEGLASLAPGLRGRIGRALRLRVAPDLHFKYDDSLQRAARIEQLLAGLKEEAPPAAEGPSATGDDPA